MIKIFYVAGIIIVLALKYFYSNADTDDLKWILTPTAWGVSFLSGIPFEYEPHVGYINHHIKFIIARSCSGVQFMIISMAALIFSFIHSMETLKKGFYWFTASLGVSYIFTIFVNTIRIVLSIYFNSYNVHYGWFTPERLHTVIGIVVYFASFIFLYNIASRTQKPTTKTEYILPALWYFAIALGIPFLNKAYENDGGIFLEYAVLVIVVATVIIFICCIIQWLWTSIFQKR